MSYALRLLLSNSLAFISFLLILFSNIHSSIGGMLRIKRLTLFLAVTVYIIIGCFDAAVATLFALFRNHICLKHPERKERAAVKMAILLIGTVFSALCAWYRGGTWEAYLPAASFLFCTVGYYLTKSPSALRIIDAADIVLFWLVFDYLNLMAFNVATDLFIVLFPFAERYVMRDNTDPNDKDPASAHALKTVS